MSSTSSFTSFGLIAKGKPPFPRPINMPHFLRKVVLLEAEMLYKNPRFSQLGQEDQTTVGKKVQSAFLQWLVNHKRTSTSNEERKYRFFFQKALDSIEERAELSRVSETLGVTGVIKFSQPIMLVVQPQAIILPESESPFHEAFNSPPVRDSWQIPRSSAFPPPSSSIQEGCTSGNPPEEGLMFKWVHPTLMSNASFEMVLANQDVQDTLAEIWDNMCGISDLVNTNPDTYLGPIDSFGSPGSPMSE